MSTAARKARKRAGEKFSKAPKVGTPVQERAVFQRTVLRPRGQRWAGQLMAVSPRALLRALRDRGIAEAE